MSARKPAVTTQLKNAKAEIDGKNVQIAELEKKLASSENMKSHYQKNAEKAEGDIEQIHALLDVLPNATGRKTEAEDSWSRKEIGIMTRLASYLAQRSAA